jgi:hypothetical protein
MGWVEDLGWRLALAKNMRTFLKNNQSNKDSSDTVFALKAQGAEFKPQYHKKRYFYQYQIIF